MSKPGQKKPKGWPKQASDTWPEGHRYHGKTGRCKGWRFRKKIPSGQCGNHADPGFRTCSTCRGATGMRNGNAKTGKYSIYHNPDLDRALRDLLQDKVRLTDFTEELATLTHKVGEIRQRLGGGSVMWSELTEVTTTLKEATLKAQEAERDGDKRGQREHDRVWQENYVRLLKLIDVGTQVEQTWEEYYKWVERLHRLIKGERLHAQRERQLMEVSLVRLILSDIRDIFETTLKDHLTDNDLRILIQNEVATAVQKSVRDRRGKTPLRRVV